MILSRRYAPRFRARGGEREEKIGRMGWDGMDGTKLAVRASELLCFNGPPRGVQLACLIVRRIGAQSCPHSPEDRWCPAMLCRGNCPLAG